MELTREYFQEKLSNDNNWLFRGVLAIYARQTFDEKKNDDVKHRNNWGFRPSDAKFLSSIAKLIKGGCQLTDKQIYVTRKKMLKYAAQLVKIAKINLSTSESK